MKFDIDYIVKRELENLGFSVISVPDRNLALPSKDWLLKSFSPYLANSLPWAFPTRTSAGEARDCDDIALWAMALSRTANARREASNEGIAFGMARIIIHASSFNGIPGPSAHVTNLVKLDTGEIYAYEPQTRTAVLLESAEFCSRFFTPSWAFM